MINLPIWVVIVAATLFIVASPAIAETITGRASVIDGDTIEVHGQRIRLEGIDAPESRQMCSVKATGETIRCGQRAAFFLADMIDARAVTCTSSGRDRYRRVLARCEFAGKDVGGEMVRAGWALAYIAYSRRYDLAEAQARKAKAGMWAHEFTPPWEWRNR